MIKTELLNDGKLIRYYSNTGMNLLQVDTNITYGSEVVDVYPSKHTYKEVEAEMNLEDLTEENANEEILRTLKTLQSSIQELSESQVEADTRLGATEEALTEVFESQMLTEERVEATEEALTEVFEMLV